LLKKLRPGNQPYWSCYTWQFWKCRKLSDPTSYMREMLRGNLPRILETNHFFTLQACYTLWMHRDFSQDVSYLPIAWRFGNSGLEWYDTQKKRTRDRPHLPKIL
jgi:hypothetical protein